MRPTVVTIYKNNLALVECVSDDIECHPGVQKVELASLPRSIDLLERRLDVTAPIEYSPSICILQTEWELGVTRDQCLANEGLKSLDEAYNCVHSVQQSIKKLRVEKFIYKHEAKCLMNLFEQECVFLSRRNISSFIAKQLCATRIMKLREKTTVVKAAQRTKKIDLRNAQSQFRSQAYEVLRRAYGFHTPPSNSESSRHLYQKFRKVQYNTAMLTFHNKNKDSIFTSFTFRFLCRGASWEDYANAEIFGASATARVTHLVKINQNTGLDFNNCQIILSRNVYISEDEDQVRFDRVFESPDLIPKWHVDNQNHTGAPIQLSQRTMLITGQSHVIDVQSCPVNVQIFHVLLLGTDQRAHKTVKLTNLPTTIVRPGTMLRLFIDGAQVGEVMQARTGNDNLYMDSGIDETVEVIEDIVRINSPKEVSIRYNLSVQSMSEPRRCIDLIVVGAIPHIDNCSYSYWTVSDKGINLPEIKDLGESLKKKGGQYLIKTDQSIVFRRIVGEYDRLYIRCCSCNTLEQRMIEAQDQSDNTTLS